jgi:protein-S-isoprenylcysteine O-methyltransferase Ste14
MFETIPIFCFSIMVLHMAFMQRKLELSGIEAMVLRNDDSTQGWLGRTFRYCIAAYLALVLIEYFAPQWIEMYVGSVPMFDHEFVAVLGAFMMIFGTCVVLWGQYSLGLAWRIGIKENDSPTFIQTGAFRYSRNPVFSGFLAITAGYSLFNCTFLSVALFATVYMGLHAQVREEEEYLRRKRGTQYVTWAAATHRWFGRSVSAN